VAFFDNLTMKYTTIIRGRCVQLNAIGASARPMAALGGFYESHEPPPLGNVRSVVPHCHGHQNGQQRGHILHCRFACCHSGGRRGNTEVVTQWRRLVAYMKALDLLHWLMRVVLHHCTAMTIEMANNRGTFVCCCCLFHLIKTLLKDNVMVRLN
jgi:hypothetical protein